jgi:excisionase family DNA binding protein
MLRTSPVTAASPPTPDEALLIGDLKVAMLLGVCRATLHRLRAAGKIPAPIKLGRAVRSNRRELESWVEAGGPPISEWNARKAADERRRLRGH